MNQTLIQLGINDRRVLASARRVAGGERELVELVIRTARLAESRDMPMAVLSTCERLEVYAMADAAGGAALTHAMHEAASSDEATMLDRRVGAAGVQHLFAVASGLESRLLGETHILGQVGRAHLDVGDGRLSRVLPRLLESAVACGRRIRSRTRLGQMATSYVDVAVGAIAARVPSFSEASFAVLGSGALALETVRRLQGLGASRVSVLARHPRREHELGPGVTSHLLQALPAVLHTFDVVLAATSAGSFLITAADMGLLGGRAVVLIDLGVPPNIDPDVREVRGVTLLGIDDLRADAAMERREVEIAREMAGRSAERWSRRWLGVEGASAATNRSEVA